MKKSLVIATAGAALASMSVLASNTSGPVDMPVVGYVDAALTLGAAIQVNMPAVVKPDSGAGTVQLDCPSGAVTYSGTGVNPFADGATGATGFGNGTPGSSLNYLMGASGSGPVGHGACGFVPVSGGEPGLNYDITTTVLNGDNGNGITLTGFSCFGDAGGTAVGVVGTDNGVVCGAQVTIDSAASTTSNMYNGAALIGRVTITYD